LNTLPKVVPQTESSGELTTRLGGSIVMLDAYTQLNIGYSWPYLRSEVYELFPKPVKQLLGHWVDREWVMSKAEAEADIWDVSYFQQRFIEF
jgi:hypothetical protein